MCWHVSSRAAALLRDRRGVTAVEFGVVGMIFVMLLLGAIEVGRYQITIQSLRSFTADSARAALIGVNNMLPDACGVPAVNQTAALARTPMLAPARLTQFNVTAGCPAVPTDPGWVQVQATYNFTFVVGFLPTLGPLTETIRLSF